MSYQSSRRPQQQPPLQTDITLDIAFRLLVMLCTLPFLPGVIIGGIGARILKARADYKYMYVCVLLAIVGVAFLYFIFKPFNLLMFLVDEISRDIKSRPNWPGLFWAILPLWGESLFLSPAVAVVWTFFLPRSVEEQALEKSRQEQTKHQQASDAAKKKLKRGRVPDSIGSDGVLGIPLSGDLTTWIAKGWFVLRTRELGQHGAVVGGSGSGKTETLLRIAGFVARVLKWQIIYVDAKGDRATAARFITAMRAVGVPRQRIRMFPADAYDGWRGDPNASLNRLIAIEEYSESYYLASAKNILLLALKDGKVKNSRELLKRLNTEELLSLYAGDEETQAFIRSIPKKEIAGVANRYRAVFAQLEGMLDGDWAYEDVDAAYILLDGLALRTIASGLGRYFVEDFAHYAGARKPSARKTLFIFDELSAVDADLTNLFERVRSRGVSVFVSAQSIEGLGYKGALANASRMLSAATTIILHRTSDPDALLERAGTKQAIQMGYSFANREATGAGNVRLNDIFRVSSEEARQLPLGEAFVIAQGRAERVAIAQMDIDHKAEEQVAEELERQLNPPERLVRPTSGPDPSLVPWWSQPKEQSTEEEPALGEGEQGKADPEEEEIDIL